MFLLDDTLSNHGHRELVKSIR